MRNDYVTINGKPSKIIYNKSKANEWSIENANLDTVNILDELSKNLMKPFKYDKGITVCNPVNTINLVSNLNITRPSNHIGILRRELGSNTLITYYSKGEKPCYGIMKSDVVIEKVNELKERLLLVIRNKEKL